MNQLFKKVKNTYEMVTNTEKQKQFKDDMVRKTWEYQKKFHFETNPRQGHEFWNVEADAFKHAFGSAEMAIDMGKFGSLAGNIHHEFITPNNPHGEWNMDSWNNREGRKIADEIRKEYGTKFDNLPQKEKDAIIATKVMIKMKNGELITHPSDTREFNGFIEKLFNNGTKTGQAAPINHIFTPQEIGKMSSEEFSRNENVIMEQLKNGQIKYDSPSIDYENYKNPETGAAKIFTREDISQMPFKEYAKYEKEIMAQLNSIGIPYQKDLPKTAETHSAQKSKKYSDSGKSKSSNSKGGTAEGKWVTINGNHVLIKD